MNNYTKLAVAQAPGEVPINEPLSAPPIGTKPNYNRNIQSGKNEQLPVTDSEETTTQPTIIDYDPVNNSNGFPWLTVALVIFGAILITAGVMYIRKNSSKKVNE